MAEEEKSSHVDVTYSKEMQIIEGKSYPLKVTIEILGLIIPEAIDLVAQAIKLVVPKG